MAIYILKRKCYSINPAKVTLSDIATEYNIQFPNEIKKLSKMERRIEAKLHHWAMTAPGIDTVASPEMMYQVLSSGESIVPALINCQGEVVLMYNTTTGKYVYGEDELEDPQAFVNVLMGDINKVMQSNAAMTESPEVPSGQAEVIKQELIYYQTYLDNIMMTFDIQPEQPQQEE